MDGHRQRFVASLDGQGNPETRGQGQPPSLPPSSPVCPCSCPPEPQFPPVYNRATVTIPVVFTNMEHRDVP